MSDWAQCCTFSGMVSLEAGYLGIDFDAQWRVAYDRENLYLACLTWMPRNTCFLAATTENDDGSILLDDHLEIQFSFQERQRAGSSRFFKIMVNPAGAVYDIIYNWLPGQNRPDWSCGKVASKTHLYQGKQHWVVEIAIPLKQLEVEDLEGKRMLLQVVRTTGSGGAYYSGWVGQPWMNWEQFGEVVFDRAVTVFSFLHCGNPGKGGLQFRAIFRGQGYTGERKMKLSLSNVVGKEILYSKQLTKDIVSGEQVEFKFNERLPVAKKGNVLKIRAAQEGPEGELLLYSAEIPFIQIDREFEESYLKPWFSRHKWVQELRVNYQYAYAPSFHKIHVWVNTRINPDLVKEEDKQKAQLLVQADKFLALVSQQNGKEISRVEGIINQQEGEGVITLPGPLPEGNYTLLIQVINSSQVVAEVKENFVRQYFPWENNRTGKEKVIIPPYQPVRQRQESLFVWGREYKLGQTGLPVSIKAEGEELLAGPVTLEIRQGEKRHQLLPEGKLKIKLEPGQKFPDEFLRYWYQASCPQAKLEPTDGYAAEVEGSGIVGDLPVKISGSMDYAGWYQIKLKLLPQGKVNLDSLDLVIPLSPEQTQLMVFKNGYGIGGCGPLPKGEGVLWKSTQLPAVANCLNSFVPIAFLGNYRRGLRWYAEWDRGWLVNDQEALMQLEREKGRLLLRCRLVNTPSGLDSPREIEFVLQAVPMKPEPPNRRRIAWKYPEPLFAHDTSGNRYYGNALDTITLYTEEEYQALKDFYYHWPAQSGRRVGKEQPEYGMAWLEPARKGYPLVEYGSTWCHGIACKEMPVFKGEWCLGEFERLKFTEVSRKGHNNYGATGVFSSDEDVTEVLTSGNESFIDFFVYYMTRLAQKCQINGTFYDNWTPFIRFPVRTDITGDAYRRPDGRLQGRFNVFRRHEWTRRMATAFWLSGRPSFQIVADEPDISFIEASWLVEGHWYHDDPVHDMIDKGITPEKFAAISCKPGQLGYVVTNIPPYIGPDGKPAGYNSRQARLILSYCLLHDLGCILYYLHYPRAEEIIKVFQEEVKFFDGAKLLPYWENKISGKQLPVEITLGGYLHPEKEKAVLIMVNTGEQKLSLPLTLKGTNFLGRPISRVKNIETGLSLPEQGDSFGPVELDPHEVIFILAE